jgi:hypothetical protein
MENIENILKAYNISTAENCLLLLKSEDIIKIISYLPDNEINSNIIDILLNFLVKFAVFIHHILSNDSLLYSTVIRMNNIKITENLYNVFKIYIKSHHRFQLAVIICLFLTRQTVLPNMLDIINPIVNKIKVYNSASNAELGLVALSLSSISFENKKLIYDLDILEYVIKILDRNELRVVVNALLVLESTSELYTDEIVNKLVKAQIFTHFSVLLESFKLSKKITFHLPIKCILAVLEEILNHGSTSFDSFLNTKIVQYLLDMMYIAATDEEEDDDDDLRLVYSEILVQIGKIFCCFNFPPVFIGSLFYLHIPFSVLDILDLLVRHLVEGKIVYKDAAHQFIIYLFIISALYSCQNKSLNDEIEKFRDLGTVQRLVCAYDWLHQLELGGDNDWTLSLNYLALCICRLMSNRKADIVYGYIFERVSKLKSSADEKERMNAVNAYNRIINVDIVLDEYLKR